MKKFLFIFLFLFASKAYAISYFNPSLISTTTASTTNGWILQINSSGLSNWAATSSLGISAGTDDDSSYQPLITFPLPAASTTDVDIVYLLPASNLSDLTSTSSARNNLGYASSSDITITSTGSVIFATRNISQFTNNSNYLTSAVTSLNGNTGAITANIWNATTTISVGSWLAVSNGGIGATTISLLINPASTTQSITCGANLQGCGSSVTSTVGVIQTFATATITNGTSTGWSATNLWISGSSSFADINHGSATGTPSATMNIGSSTITGGLTVLNGSTSLRNLNFVEASSSGSLTLNGSLVVNGSSSFTGTTTLTQLGKNTVCLHTVNGVIQGMTGDCGLAGVTSVTGSGQVLSSGGTTPNISLLVMAVSTTQSITCGTGLIGCGNSATSTVGLSYNWSTSTITNGTSTSWSSTNLFITGSSSFAGINFTAGSSSADLWLGRSLVVTGSSSEQNANFLSASTSKDISVGGSLVVTGSSSLQGLSFTNATSQGTFTAVSTTVKTLTIGATTTPTIMSGLYLNALFSWVPRVITATTTLNATDTSGVILTNGTTTVTVVLPSCSKAGSGLIFRIKAAANGATANVRIITAGTDLIDNTSTKIISTANSSFDIISYPLFASPATTTCWFIL